MCVVRRKTEKKERSVYHRERRNKEERREEKLTKDVREWNKRIIMEILFFSLFI